MKAHSNHKAAIRVTLTLTPGELRAILASQAYDIAGSVPGVLRIYLHNGLQSAAARSDDAARPFTEPDWDAIR